MAASDALNKDLFHGTSALLPIGGVLEPKRGAAYASPDFETARQYAVRSAISNRALFGTVYRVKPKSDAPKVNEFPLFTEVVDPQGMDILEMVASPVNPWAHK